MPGLIAKICCSLLLFTVSGAMGQARFSATVTPREIGKDEYTQLRLIVENSADVRQIIPPSLKDFVVLSGPSQESGMSNINGSVSQYTGISYLIKPKRSGTFTIPSAIAIVDGKKLSSQPVTVKVSNTATGNSAQPGGGMFTSPFAGMDPFEEPETPVVNEDLVLKPGEDPRQKIARNMFVKLETDKTSCYVGEPVVATYKLYTRLPSESNMTKNPSFNGFSVIDLQQPGNNDYRREKLNGKEYNVYTIRKAQLYPLQAGKLDLEIAEIENNIHFVKAAYASKAAGAFGIGGLPPEALVDQKVSLQSQPMSIEVKPLPDAGKPAAFKGAVGEFTVEALLAKKEFTTDDAGTLRIIVSGQGNLQLITAPEVSWPAGMESFDAKTSDDLYRGTVPVSGKKMIDYPFTVAEPGNYTLPPVQFSFFNPQTGKYKTVSTEPVSFTVTKGTGKKTYTNNSVTEVKEQSLLNRFFSNRLRVVSVVACLILLGLIVWLKRDRKVEQLKAEELAIAAAKEKAEQESVQELLEQQKNPLTETEYALEAGDTAAFFKHLDEELRKYLSHKLHIPTTELSKKSIGEELDRNGISNETCLLLHQLLDEIEWQRYTPFSGSDKMQDMYERANAMIQLLNTYKT